MKLTYLYHSGFLWETSSCYLIFDYFFDGALVPVAQRSAAGVVQKVGERQSNLTMFADFACAPVRTDVPGVVDNLMAHLDKPLYLLSSHFHRDHFTTFLFDLYDYARERRQDNPNYPSVKLILSSDIKKKRKKFCEPYLEAITFIKKGEIYEDALVNIGAGGSTDVGISFAVTAKADNCRLFHAGDLNFWHWSEEQSAKEMTVAHKFFQRELKFISEHYPYFDVVLFPVDPRLQKDITAGAREFTQKIPTSFLVPMHMFEQSEVTLDALQSDLAFASWPLWRGELSDKSAVASAHSLTSSTAAAAAPLLELPHPPLNFVTATNQPSPSKLPILSPSAVTAASVAATPEAAAVSITASQADSAAASQADSAAAFQAESTAAPAAAVPAAAAPAAAVPAAATPALTQSPGIWCPQHSGDALSFALVERTISR